MELKHSEYRLEHSIRIAFTLNYVEGNLGFGL